MKKHLTLAVAALAALTFGVIADAATAADTHPAPASQATNPVTKSTDKGPGSTSY